MGGIQFVFPPHFQRRKSPNNGNALWEWPFLCHFQWIFSIPRVNFHLVNFPKITLFCRNNSSQKFRIELRQRRRPFRRRSECLGKAELRIICDQNDCIISQIELRRIGQEGIVGKLRIQICSYDDPLYIWLKSK